MIHIFVWVESRVTMSYSVGFSQSLEILFYIELKTKNGEEKYLTIQQISEKMNIPVPSVKRLIGLLKKAGFIESKKGVNGGLALTKTSRDIYVYDVFEAIEGHMALFKQYDNFEVNSLIHKSETRYMLSKSKEIFEETENAMREELKKYKLSDLFATDS
jgi:Rrf2 family protein